MSVNPDSEEIIEEQPREERINLVTAAAEDAVHINESVTGWKLGCNLIVITRKIMLLLLSRQR